jgi:hypothetical protein
LKGPFEIYGLITLLSFYSNIMVVTAFVAADADGEVSGFYRTAPATATAGAVVTEITIGKKGEYLFFNADVSRLEKHPGGVGWVYLVVSQQPGGTHEIRRVFTRKGDATDFAGIADCDVLATKFGKTLCESLWMVFKNPDAPRAKAR